MSSQYNCDYCNNLVYDEEIEGYVCDVDMDEDDYARLLSISNRTTSSLNVTLNISEFFVSFALITEGLQ